MVNKEELAIFKNAIEVIDLYKIYLTNSAFHFYEENMGPNLKVSFQGEVEELKIQKNFLYVDYKVKMEVNSEGVDATVFDSEFNYMLRFTYNEREPLENLLNSTEALDFFKNVQIKKIIAPYIRQHFHSMLSDTLLVPFDMPLLK